MRMLMPHPPSLSQGGGGAKSGAVISAAAVRNRQPDDDDGGDADGSGAATAAQIAMLGGQWKPSAEPPPVAAIGPAQPGQARCPPSVCRWLPGGSCALRPCALSRQTLSAQRVPGAGSARPGSAPKLTPVLSCASGACTLQRANSVSRLPQKRKPTPAMGVSDFMGKGGGAALPRSVPGRRDKEQAKRLRGQSSHATWKSEAEMQLRQNFDS